MYNIFWCSSLYIISYFIFITSYLHLNYKQIVFFSCMIKKMVPGKVFTDMCKSWVYRVSRPLCQSTRSYWFFKTFMSRATFWWKPPKPKFLFWNVLQNFTRLAINLITHNLHTIALTKIKYGINIYKHIHYKINWII